MKKPTAGAPVPKAKVKPHHPGKPVHVTAAVRAKRHAAAVKASKTRAANAKKAKQHPQAKQHPRRQLALGDGVACCSAEALAASLRLAGEAVSDDDVLALYWRTASDADAGASILATLEAASVFGLGGRYRPSGYRCCPVREQTAEGIPVDGVIGRELLNAVAVVGASHALILGISLPAPHAVLATADGWWSWGELHDPWTDDIDEAWEVTWPGIR